MRTLDRPAPLDPYPAHPTAGLVASRLRLAVERLPFAPYLWDDDETVWDSPDPAVVWDAPFVGAGLSDAVCDFTALTIEVGDPDGDNLIPAGRLEVSLANPDGRWSLYNDTGSLAFFAPGRAVHCWAVADPGDPEPAGWWLFSGRVARWEEHTDGTVTLEAFDGLSILAQPLGHDWTPGLAGDTVPTRLTKILEAAGWPSSDPVRLDPSSTVLGAPISKRSPLEEAQVSGPLSDGGVLFVDADGTLIYRNRNWPGGREDQTSVPAFTDNLCHSDAVEVWDLEAVSSDERIANRVVLTNAAATPVTVTANLDDPLYGSPPNPPLIVTHSEPDLWSVTADGQTLAAELLRRASNRATSYAWTLYPLDPSRDLWETALDRRLGDRVRVVRNRKTVDGVTVLDLELVLATIRHEITPGQWIVTLETSKAVEAHLPQLWDLTGFTWDDPDPESVWSY